MKNMKEDNNQEAIDIIDETLLQIDDESANSLLAKERRGEKTHEQVVYDLEARSLQYQNAFLKLKGMLLRQRGSR